jgi:AmiR/NasT family two-component response regulator
MTELREAASAEDLEFWRARAEQLQYALDSRVIIEQAKGAISARLEVDPKTAFEMLRGLARSQRRELHEFAAEVVANRGRLDGAAAPRLKRVFDRR